MKRERLDFFTAFVKISQAISSSRELQDVLIQIVDSTMQTLGMMAGAISLLNKHENRLEMITHINLGDDFLRKGPVLADKSMPRAMATKAPVVVENIDHDDQLQYPNACRKEGIKAILSIPIIFKDEIIGVLRLYDSKIRTFNSTELEFATAVAEQGGVAIENARFIDRLKKSHLNELDDVWQWFSDLVETPKY